jgi:hypothetical protein
VIKLLKPLFKNKFLFYLFFTNLKITNFLFLKFYFLIIQNYFLFKNYFLFNFFFYKKIWNSKNFLFINFNYKFKFKKFYKKYYFLNLTSFLIYNFNILTASIFFYKNNKNFIFKHNFFFSILLKLKILPFLFNFIKNFYFLNFYFNKLLLNYIINLNTKFFLFNDYKVIKTYNNSNYFFKSIRQFSNYPLLTFNNLI